MWQVSDRFLDALGTPGQQRISTCTVQVPGGTPQPLQIVSGNISADSTATARRKGYLEVQATAAQYDLITTDGAEFKVTHGLSFGADDQELIPIGTFEIVDGTQDFGGAAATFNVVDHSQWLAGCAFVTPYSPDPSLTRIAALTAAVEAAKPGTALVVTSTDLGLAGSRVWDAVQNSPLNVASDLGTDGMWEAFFQVDGSYLVRDLLTLNSPPVWTIGAGVGGTLKTASRNRPFDKMYNAVVVQPSGADQTWSQQIAQVTDPNDPRHPSKIGLRPSFWSSPTILDAPSAMAVAESRLALLLGNTETLSLSSVSNPALTEGDVVRVNTPAINDQPALIFQHFIDSISSFDLVTGEMQLATRSQVVIDESEDL
jgi:hypothetical protein